MGALIKIIFLKISLPFVIQVFQIPLIVGNIIERTQNIPAINVDVSSPSDLDIRGSGLVVSHDTSYDYGEHQLISL